MDYVNWLKFFWWYMNESSILNDQNVEIYAVSRTTPVYVVNWPKLKLKTCHWSVQRGQLFFYKERASFTATWW